MTMCHGFSKKIAGGIKEFTIIGIDKNHTDYWWPVPESRSIYELKTTTKKISYFGNNFGII